MLAGIYRGNQQEIWVNGLLQAMRSGSASYYVNPVDIGKYSGGAGCYTEGSIDEVRIYNRALSDQEIKALYEATK